MCGLVGVAGDLKTDDEALTKSLLLFDYHRGRDSTGLGVYNKGNKPSEVVKIASHPINFFDTRRCWSALNALCAQAFIGHNRAATKGKVTENNAHPFYCGKIIGAHNGTLDDESHKRLNKSNGFETETDSEAIFWSIDKIGIEETMKMLRKGNTYVTGAWALVWVDTEEGVINFLRNEHRPLWYAFSKDLDKIYWGSEWEIIRAGLEIGKDKGKRTIFRDKKGHGYWSFEEDYLYSIKLDDLAEGFDKKPKMRVKKLKGMAPLKVPTTTNTHRSNGSPFVMGGTTQNGTTNTGKTSSTTRSRSDGDRSWKTTLELQSNEESPFGMYIPRERAIELSGSVCGWCHEDLDFSKPGIVVYENVGSFLCPKCSGNTQGEDIANKVYIPPSDFDSMDKLMSEGLI